MIVCTCNGKFLDAEDFRDHLPCPGPPNPARDYYRKKCLEARAILRAILLTDERGQGIGYAEALKAADAWCQEMLETL